MANDNTGTALQTTEERPRAVRTYSPVEDVVPLLDTARFEHMQRIAVIMAKSSLVPETLRGERKNQVFEPYGAETVVSNCFLVTEQAVRWNMSPFAVAQCASVVHGRLMFEGKLVAAVLEKQLGTRLSYEFGTWQPATETVDLTKEGSGDLLGVRVSGVLPGETEVKTVEGAVGLWKTTGNNSPWKPGSFKRQLRYRGAREWSRAHSPGAMLGVVTDDELDVLAERRESLRHAEAAIPALTAGFGDETDQNFRTKAAEKAPDKATADPKAAKGQGELVEESKAPAEEIVQGHAAPGENYLLAGDEFSDKGRRPTYQDGKPFSSVGEPGAAKLKVYSEHAPEKEEASGDERPTETDGARGAESEQGTSETATNVASDGAEETSGTTASDEQSPKPKDDGGFPGDKTSEQLAAERAEREAEEGEGAVEPNPFMAVHEALQGKPSWMEIKSTIRDFAGTEAYKSAEDEGKRMLRLWAWERYVELQEGGQEATVLSEDITLFRFWLEFAAENEDQINANFRALFKSEVYKSASSADQKMIGDLIANRKETLAATSGGGR